MSRLLRRPSKQLVSVDGPARMHVFVFSLAIASSVIVAVALTTALSHPRPHLLMLTAAAAAVLVGDIKLIEIRIGHHGNGFTWAEAALILGASLAGWDWFIPIGVATLLVRQLAVGRVWEKAVFNSAAFATGTLAAELGFALISGHRQVPPSDLTLRDAVAWVVAAAIFWLWVSIAVAVAVGWSQQLSIRAMWQRGAKVRTLTFAGNSAAGLGTLAVGHWNRPTAALLPFFFLLLYLAYNNFLRAQQEGETWRQLHAATLSLKRIDSRAVLSAVARAADTLFGSEVTEVILDGDPRVRGVPVPHLLAFGLATPGVVSIQAKTAPPLIAAELELLSLHSATMAPLESVGRRMGVLLIGFRGPIKFKRRERTVLATFADQTSISLQHARLFEELSAERGRLGAIVQHASDGILLVDGEGRVCSWNPALTLMTGRDQTAALGMPLGDALNASNENGTPLDGRQIITDLQENEQVRLAAGDADHDGRAAARAGAGRVARTGC